MTNLFIALVFAATTPASPASAETQSPPAKTKTVEEKKVCKRIPSTTSRMGSEKVCMTAAEWKKQENSFY